jgi:PAS domain S-box-containing protein
VEVTGAAAPASLPVRTDSSPLADAAALGLSALAEVLTRTESGIAVADAGRRYVYANPAACRMLGHPLDQLRGRDFLGSFPRREHATMLDRLPEHVGDEAAPFTCILLGSDGEEREIVCSIFAIDVVGRLHSVAIFQDLTGPRRAARTAVALAQTAAQLVGTGTTDEILADLARHAVEGTRALSCGIVVVGEDHKLASAGAYGPNGPGYGETNPAWTVLTEFHVEEIIEAMTSGLIVVGDAPAKPVVLPDARLVWEANPVTKAFAATLKDTDWKAGVYVPLSWDNRVFGFFSVLLPSRMAGPSEEELAFYTALADQAAVAVTNARLTSQARQAAALLERTRLARELHDSVSQALFSMTMHARAAQLAMARSGMDEGTPLGRSVAQLAELTRGALAEMRALIFELRPGALAEEGLVGALRKQGAALTAREQIAITVDGPEERLELRSGVEEHLYRIVSEALHNVVKHARADNAAVSIIDSARAVRIVVTDDGAGFDPDDEHAGHLGLSIMGQRAEAIGADLAITSTLGTGTTVALSLPHDLPSQAKAAPGAR